MSVSSSLLLLTPVISILEEVIPLGTLVLKENIFPVILEEDDLVPDVISPNSFLNDAFKPEKKLPLRDISSPKTP